jgi:hypothetical protein
MCYAQLRVFPASPHIHWPGARTDNAWVQAFDWVRQNTPRDALFALDPRYMERPGEDNHGFRALAERSMMAEYTKDRAVAAAWPEVAETWRVHIDARQDWREFTADDFRQLRKRFSVTWVIVERPGADGLPCPYANEHVMVCRVE